MTDEYRGPGKGRKMVIGLCAVICGLILVALGFRYLLIPVMVG